MVNPTQIDERTETGSVDVDYRPQQRAIMVDPAEGRKVKSTNNFVTRRLKG
jgi:hypothetical protein